MKRFSLAFSLMALATSLLAQDWKGQGRIFGTVTGPDGEPVSGATITLFCPERGGGTSFTTDEKGKWAYQGLAGCRWNVDIKADGFETKSISMRVSERPRPTPIIFKLEKPKGPPPELVEALKNGDTAFAAEQWADARINYEKVSEMRPDLAPPLYPRLARIYAAEKNTERALEFLQKSIDVDPGNQQFRFVAANAAVEAGLSDQALVFLEGIDDAQIKNGDGYYDIAVAFLRKNESANAVTYFTKALAKDPKIVEAYYWRGISYLQQQKMEEATADMEKVVELEPTGPNGEKAKKALETLKQD